MTTPDIELQISISETDISADQLDRLTVSLMRQLRSLGAESVERTSAGPPPKGAKGTGVTTGTLNVVAIPNFVDRLMHFLRAWSSRGGQRTVKIETPTGLRIEFTPDQALSPEEMVAFVQSLTTGTTPAAPLPSNHSVDTRCRIQLRELLTTYFSESELRTLCFYLAITYEDLSGNNRAEKIIELIKYAERHNRIAALLENGRELRPDVPWDRICQSVAGV